MRTRPLEILDNINKNPESISLYKNDTIITAILGYGFNPYFKFKLPKGTPPYKKSEIVHPEAMPTSFNRLVRKWKLFLNDSINEKKREAIFIGHLENMHASYAELMIHIKDQTLTKKYPNITLELLNSHGFINDEVYQEIIDSDNFRAENEGTDDGPDLPPSTELGPDVLQSGSSETSAKNKKEIYLNTVLSILKTYNRYANTYLDKEINAVYTDLQKEVVYELVDPELVIVTDSDDGNVLISII